MMRLTKLTIPIWLVLLLAGTSQAKEWRGIVPLVSTRTEVEQLLGTRSKNIGATYDFTNETVHVYYAMLSCSEWPQPPRGWNVPKNTVVRVLVFPKTRRLLQFLGIDLSNFKRERPSSCMPQEIFYRNDDEGFGIQVMESGNNNETVFGYDYYPGAEQGKRFHCPEY